MMRKSRIFLTVLSLFLGVSGLSGCGGFDLSSLGSLQGSSSSTAASTGSSSSPDSTAASTGSSSSPGSTSVSTSAPAEEEKLDLTAAPVSHNAITPSDAQVVELVHIGESSVTKIEQIPAGTISLVKNL